MPSQIDTKAKRDRLSKRREPYWHKVILGGYLGYRVGSKGGTWLARYRDDEGKQRHKSLDLPTHLPANEFDCAIGEAQKWFYAQQQGFRAKAGTVAEAVQTYVEYLAQRKGAPAAKVFSLCCHSAIKTACSTNSLVWRWLIDQPTTIPE